LHSYPIQWPLGGGDAVRGMIVSGGGWTAIVELFAKAAQ
jgi:hypothetical protein